LPSEKEFKVNRFVLHKGTRYEVIEKTLDLQGKRIKDIKEIEGLEKLVDLEELYLSQNHIKKIENLESLKSLKKLDLNRNLISKIEGLENLGNLEYLVLSDNQISELKNLDNLSILRQLWLAGNNIEEIKKLDKLKNLEYLSLGKNKISKIKGLNTLENLTYLDLSENEITNISNLETLQKLQTLYIGYNKIKDISILSQLKEIEKLSIPHNEISNVIPLSMLPKLKEVKLYSNKLKLNQFINEIEFINLKGRIAKRIFQDLSRKEVKLLRNLIDLNDQDAQKVYFKVLSEKSRSNDLESVNILLDSSYIEKIDTYKIKIFLQDTKKKFIPNLFSKLTNIKSYYNVDYVIDFLISNANYILADDKKVIGRWIISLNHDTIIELIENGFLRCLNYESIEGLINDHDFKQKLLKSYSKTWILKEFLKYGSEGSVKIMKDMFLESIISIDHDNFSDYIENNYLNYYNEEEFEELLVEHWSAFYSTFSKMLKKDFRVFPSNSLKIKEITSVKIKIWLQEIILSYIKAEFSSRVSREESLKKYFNILSCLNNKSIIISLLEILEDNYWAKPFSDIKRFLLKANNYNTKKLILQLGRFIYTIKSSCRNYFEKLFEEMHEFLKCVMLGCYSTSKSTLIEKIIIIFQLILILNEVIAYNIGHYMDVATRKYDLDSYDKREIEDQEFESRFSIKKESEWISLKIKKSKLLISYLDNPYLKKKFKEFNQENNEFKLNVQRVIDEGLLEQAWFRNHLHYFFGAKKYQLLLRNLTVKFNKKKRRKAEENELNSKELIMFRNTSITRKEARTLEEIEFLSTQNFTHEDEIDVRNCFISSFNTDYITDNLDVSKVSKEEYLRNFDEIIIYSSMAFTTNNHHVTGLSLKDSKIKKLPPSIGSLTELRELYVTTSDIWSEITSYSDFLPESIGNLKKLEILIITRQRMKALPKSIGNLTNLYHMNLSGNELETLPETIGNLHSLRVLILDSNKIKIFPQSLSKLKSLITLSLTGEGNIIIDTKGLRNLENLEFLTFMNNQYKEIPDLKGLNKLKILNFRNNELVEVNGVENLNNLKILDLGNNRISEIKCLENLCNLRVLELSDNTISKIKGFENLTNLEILDLSDNNISEVKGLDNSTNLKALWLSRNKIFEITGLNALTKLKSLGIDHNNIKELKGLENLLKLENFSIGTCFPKDLVMKLGGYKEEYNPLGKEYAYADDPSQFVEYCCRLVNKNVNFYKIREEKFYKLLKERFLIDNVKMKILKAIYDNDPNDIDLIIENLDDSYTNSGNYQHIFQLIKYRILIKESDTRTVRMNPPARSALTRIYNERVNSHNKIE